MDIGVLSGVVGAVAAVVAVPIAAYYGHRSTKSAPTGPRVQVRVENGFPAYATLSGGQRIGDHVVLINAVNTGDRAVTITGWGVKLPGDVRLVLPDPLPGSTPLPHRLEPGSEPARFLLPGDEMFRIQRERAIPFKRMTPYVTLADGTDVLANRAVPLAP